MSQVPALQPGDDCFRLAMAASGLGTAIVGLDRRWVHVNPAFERMFGYRADEVIGRADADLTHPEDLQRASAALDELLDGRIEFVDSPTRYVHRNGETIWAHAHVAVMRGGDGAPQCLLVQLRDASAERDAERGLRASAEARAEALDASNRQLLLFADAVSHDLRAPLRSIESFSALLGERIGGDLDDTSRDHLDRIRAAARRMSSLLAALSDLSYATRAELKCERVDLSLLADWVIAELEDAEPEREVQLSVQPRLVGYGDERLLKLLMSQLLGNAWKFSGGQPHVRIEVSGHSGDTGLDLSVRDAGSGFDMRYAHKLFEPFQRLHGPEQGGGHGLGLAIAQRIVERHHGRLTGESGLLDDRAADDRPHDERAGHGNADAGDGGRGSVFHVHLPAPPA